MRAFCVSGVPVQKYLATYWVKHHAEIELQDSVDPEMFVRTALLPPDSILRSIVKADRREDDAIKCDACIEHADRTVVTLRPRIQVPGPLSA